jgi:hypothetical protein
MRLVTFQRNNGNLRAGALIEGDARVVDLAEAHTAAFHRDGPASILALVEGGDAALDRAYEGVKRAPASAILARADVRLRAPIQPPPQMRDCLCFELHLKQAFAASRKLAAMQGPDPEKAIAEIERSGVPNAPPIFYKQPIYYKANRFAVIGTDDNVVWPAYSKFLDFELEFGVFIKGKVKDAPKEGALKHVFGYTIFNDVSAHGPLPRHGGRDPRSLQPHDDRAGERRGMGPRKFGLDVLEVRGFDFVHLAFGNPLPGGVSRLGHGRQRLRARAHALHQTGRPNRARGRAHRRLAQSRSGLLIDGFRSKPASCELTE